MPLGHHEFLNEIQEYKEQQGLVTTDDDYRKRFWLPYLPVDVKADYEKHRRENFTPFHHGAKNTNGFRMEKVEKPTRIVDKGFILGFDSPIPRYINRGSAVAKEFQGARLRIKYTKNPYYPRYIPNPVVHYLMRRNSLGHRDCLDVGRDSATLWRDLINSTLDNKVISGIPMWYHPMITTVKERFDQRWPLEKRKTYPEQYFSEFCRLFHTPSRIFVQDWIDEQLEFPWEDYLKLKQAAFNINSNSTPAICYK